MYEVNNYFLSDGICTIEIIYLLLVQISPLFANKHCSHIHSYENNCLLTKHSLEIIWYSLFSIYFIKITVSCCEINLYRFTLSV